MGRMLAQESTLQCAKDSLDKLTANIFHHSMSSEEAYFVAEMARGVDGAVAGKVCDTVHSERFHSDLRVVCQQWSSMYKRNP